MSDKSRVLFLLLLSVASLFFGARVAHACSCGPKPTVLEAYESSDVVVITRAVSVEKAEKAAPEGQMGDAERYVDGVKSTRMVVEKVYKGGLKAGDEMTFKQGGGADCVWTFSEESVGQQYLFYLTSPTKGQKAWVGFGCGRSNGLKHAGDDLLYLNKLDKVRGKTRLSGTLEFDGNDDLHVGRLIRVVGEKKKTYEARTDANGVYEIYDLPAGKYSVEPEIPAGWKVAPFWLTYSASFDAGEDFDPRKVVSKIPIVLEDKKHAALDLHFEIDNVIRGRVLDAEGKPLKGVCVTAARADGKDNRGGFDCTDDAGSFAIDELQPGNYLLVANDEGKISSSEPFRPVFYPNVFEREKAGVITIGAGDKLEDFNLYVPKLEETVTVEGVFLYSDGKPVVEERVEFKAGMTEGNVDGNARATTDAKGRFRIKILKGLQGELYGEIYTYEGEYENCPKLDALVKKTGQTVPDIRTPAVKIQADGDLFDVELKYTFPACKKATK